MQLRHSWRLSIVLMCWTATVASAEDPFTFNPDPPVPGMALEIGFKPDVQPTLPLWIARAKQNGTEVDKKEEVGLPKTGEFNDSVAKITEVRPNTRYEFTVTFQRKGDEELWGIQLDFDDTKQTNRKITSPKMITPPQDVAPVVPKSAAGAEPSFLEGKATVQEKLAAAKTWAEEIAKFPKTDNLIVSIEFLKQALEKRREYPREDKLLVHSTLKKKMDGPLICVALLKRAADNVVKAQPADADAATLELAWLAERDKFLSSLVTEADEARSTADVWRMFLDDWQAEAKRVAPTRFRDALLELPLVLTAILLDFERQHILNAMTGAGPRGTSTATAAGGAGYGFGTSHAAVHHARAMSRIRMRHQRQMARLGAY